MAAVWKPNSQTFFTETKLIPKQDQLATNVCQNSTSQQVNTARQKEKPAPHRRHHCRHYHHHTFIFPFENEPDLETIFMLTTSQVNNSVCLENNINYLDWIDLMLTMVRVNLNCTHVIITEMWSQLVGAWEPVRSKGKQGKAGIKIHNIRTSCFLSLGNTRFEKLSKTEIFHKLIFTKKKL